MVLTARVTNMGGGMVTETRGGTQTRYLMQGYVRAYWSQMECLCAIFEQKCPKAELPPSFAKCRGEAGKDKHNCSAR